MCVVRRENGIDFLSFRLWIGVWVSLVLLLAVALDLSALIRYITRFTEESFAVLISVIFIYESFVNVADIWTTHPVRTVAGVEPCYCALGANKTASSNDHKHATLTVRLNNSNHNNSLYRFISVSSHLIVAELVSVHEKSLYYCFFGLFG